MSLPKIKPSLYAQLELFILLVYYDIKDSYLVDCCFLEAPDAAALVQSVCRKYGLDCDILVVIIIGSDVFVVNKPKLLLKLADAATNRTSSIIVNVTEDSLSLATEVVQFDILVELHKCISAQLPVCASHAEISLLQLELPVSGLLSMPLIAGWLLGYPSVYQSITSSDMSTPSGKLTMIELVKVSFTGRVALQAPGAVPHAKKPSKTKPVEQSKTQSKTVVVEILGFSIPSGLLELNLDVKSAFDSAVESIWMKLLQQVGTLAQGNGGISLTDIEKHVTVSVVPSIVL